jgi:hypothetical protein
MLTAALMSALSWCPHATQWKTAWLSRFSFATLPHCGQVWDVKAGFTTMSRTPARAHLSVRTSRMRPHRPAWMPRLRPAFARAAPPTGRPGHPRDVEVLYGDDVELAHQLGGGLVYPVLTRSGLMGLHAGEFCSDPLAPVGGEHGLPAAALLVDAVFAGQVPLQFDVLLLPCKRRFGHVEERAVTRGERVDHAGVDPHHRARLLPRDG